VSWSGLPGISTVPVDKLTANLCTTLQEPLFNSLPSKMRQGGARQNN
jgi:hypothetical protein